MINLTGIKVLGAMSIISSIGFLFVLFFLNPIKKGRYSGSRKMVIVSALLICSVIFAWLAVWPILEILSGNPKFENIPISAWPSELIKYDSWGIKAVILSIVKALQTFSLDADYEVFILASERISEILSNSLIVKNILKGYALGLCVAAPITGGAVLFEIIASIFPRLKLFATRLTPWREVIYFSELNEQSIALAQSIRKDRKRFQRIRTAIVFTDVYTDKEEEKSVELLLSAKAIGAICVTDDILHIHINWFFKKKIILIDKNEISNIQALTVLKEKRFALKNTDVFVFSNNDAYAEVAYKIGDKLNQPEKEKREAKEQAKKKTKEQNNKKNIKKDDTQKQEDDDVYKKYPYRIYTVNGYRQLVRNLLSEVPLYEPLINRINLLEYEKENKKYDLNITIIGAGDIGTEMFLSTYWYGQILNCQLNINVISQESEIEFINRINYINPDIFDTCEKNLSTQMENDSQTNKTAEYKDLMRIYPNNDEKIAEPYFKFRYYQTNVKDDDLDEKLISEKWNDGFRLVDSDYIMVALGSDENNLSVASNIGRYLETIKIANKADKRTVVAYVVYDSALCSALNAQKNTNSNNVYMHAFGSMNEVYNMDNVFMLEMRKSEKEIFDSYQGVAMEVQQKLYESSYQYDYWSSIARALHIKYKVFSAGYINCSVFDNYDSKIRQQELDEALECYKRDIIPYALLESDNAKEKEKIKRMNQRIVKENKRKVNAEIYFKLAWLEHRRWNAFSRVNGFRKPVGFKVYEDTGKHKNLDLKLHSCLVETDYRPEIYDCLDYLSDDLFSVQKKIDKNAKKKDFKKYDAPGHDFKCNDNGELKEQKERKCGLCTILDRLIQKK